MRVSLDTSTRRCPFASPCTPRLSHAGSISLCEENSLATGPARAQQLLPLNPFPLAGTRH